MRHPLAAAVLALSLVPAACGGSDAGGVEAPSSSIGSPPAASAHPTSDPSPTGSVPAGEALDDVRLALEPVGSGFDSPTFVTPLLGTEDLLVVEQPGRIRRLAAIGEITDWLDLSDRVGSGGNEQGLLGLALRPDFPTDDRVWVHYTDGDGATTLDVLHADTNSADPVTRVNLLSVPQPAANHNGGMLAFGPDGMLYLALGDGGAAGDRFDNGQDPRTLLGTIVRLDVLDQGDGYVAAAGNPFVDGVDGDDRVWVYGLRNPWRFAFGGDRILIGDVGQGSFEEVSTLRVPGDGGANLGWPITEGPACFRPASDCDRTGLTPPIVTYATGEAGTCAIVQGPVYRGSLHPALSGHAFYSDFCAGFLRSFRLSDGGEAVDQRDWTAQVGALDGVTSLGADADGELLVTLRDGRILRVVPAG